MPSLISQDDVAHIAHLAHIHLTPKEMEKYTQELSGILEYVRQLEKVDTRGVPPAAHAIGSTNVLRDDVARQQTSNVRDALLASVPTRDGEHVKVKAVFTNE